MLGVNVNLSNSFRARAILQQNHYCGVILVRLKFNYSTPVIMAMRRCLGGYFLASFNLLWRGGQFRVTKPYM